MLLLYLFLLLLLLELGLEFQDVLVFLSQQATELLVTLAEVGLTRYEGLVALTQLLVQLPTNTKVGKARGREWVKTTYCRDGMSKGRI